MRHTLLAPLALTTLLACAGCGAPSSPAANSSNAGAGASPVVNASQTVVVPPVSSAHGGGAAPPAAAPSGPAASDKPGMATPELDAKIEKAEAKAKAKGAGDADKKAAAAAFVERGDVYYSAQQPSLYKFALGDFRRALRYDPQNQEARQKMDQLVSIYNSMGRPVPTNGQDQ